MQFMKNRFRDVLERLIGVKDGIDQSVAVATLDAGDLLGSSVVPRFLRKVGKRVDNLDALDVTAQVGTYSRNDFVCIRAGDGRSHPGIGCTSTRTQ